jgi:hypothetical protein
VHHLGADRGHLDLEDGLDRPLDLDLVRVASTSKVLPGLLAQDQPLR